MAQKWPKDDLEKRVLPPGIEKVGQGYRGRFRTPDGRRHSTHTYQTIRDAQWALGQAKTDIQRGTFIDPRRASITLDKWMTRWMPTRTGVRAYVLDKDRARYDNHIKPYLGNVPLIEITTLTVERWMGDLERDGRNLPTIRAAHTLLRTALGKKGAIGDRRVPANPCEIARPPAKERRKWQLVTRAQFDRLLAEMDERWRPLLITAAFTGLRWSELVGLDRHHYNPLKGTLSVERRLVTHKGRLDDDAPKSASSRRKVPLHPTVIAALNEVLDGALPDAPIFRSATGRRLSQRVFFRDYYNPARERAGLPSVRFHDLRHSCASWLLNGGMDIHEVMEYLGHASITTTQLYAHTDDEEMREALVKAFG